MRKKLLAVVTAAVLALGCASAAFAAPSYDWDLVKDAFKAKGFNFSNVTTKIDGTIVECSLLADGDLEDADWVKKNLGAIVDTAQANADVVKKTLYTDLRQTSGASKVLAIFNCKYGNLDETNGSEIVFYVNDVKAGDDIKMWHWNKNRLQWENSTCQVTKVEYNHVTVKVKELSPVAFVKGGKGTSATSDNKADASKTATGAKAAPKTGEV